MKILICDDDPLFVEQERKMLEKYAVDCGKKYEITACQSGEELLQKTRAGIVNADVIFMDIEMGKRSGIDTALEINRLLPNISIVYLTGYLYYAIDVYSTKHTYFVTKEQFERRLPEIMKKLEEENQKRRLVFLVNGAREIVDADEICYFERELRQTKLQLVSRSLMLRRSIDALIDILPSGEFIRCHKSFIVSLRHVRAYEKDHFIMDDETEISISRSYSRNVKEAFALWSRAQL